MMGGSSITAAIPLRTRVRAWFSRRAAAVVLSSGLPIQRVQVLASTASDVDATDPLAYLHASVRAVMQGRDSAGLLLHASTELPVGAGLGSSAALTLASVASVAHLTGNQDPEIGTICALARRAECDELHTGAGWMDFLACGYGGVNRVVAEEIPRVQRILTCLHVPIVIVDTLLRRHTKRVLASKKQRFLAGDRAILEYAQVTTQIVGELNSELHHRRIDYSAVGRLLTAAHEQLRDRVGCSTELLDTCISRMLAAGAYGAKLSGSGYGGCLFALVPEDALLNVLASVESLPVYALPLNDSEVEGLRFHSTP